MRTEGTIGAGTHLSERALLVKQAQHAERSCLYQVDANFVILELDRVTGHFLLLVHRELECKDHGIEVEPARKGL